MRTIEEIKDRCHVEDGDDGREHWIWRGATRDGSPNVWAPNYTIDPTGNTMTVQSGPRAVRHVLTGKPIRRGHTAYGTCGDRLCLNPACIDCGTKSKFGRMVRDSGREKGKANRIAAAHRNSTKQSKVTPQMVADAYAMRNKDAAAKHGVHRDLITRIRMGESIAARAVNPFAALMR